MEKERVNKKIRVLVKTNASENKIIGFENNILHVNIKEKPIDNKANKTLIKLLSKHFKKHAKITSGITSSLKTILLE